MRKEDRKVIDLDYFPNKYSGAWIIKSLSWFQIFVLEFPILVNLKCTMSIVSCDVSTEFFSKFQNLFTSYNWCNVLFDYNQI